MSNIENILDCKEKKILISGLDPILQDDKIIGAVTHVFVEEPTKGYAVFMENMLDT